jgi:hypothetical protein
MARRKNENDARPVSSSRRGLIAQAATSLGALALGCAPGTALSAVASGNPALPNVRKGGARPRGSNANSSSVAVLDVRAAPFSCVGDGVADDTAGMQAALSAFAEATRAGRSVRVHIPAGRYVVNAMLEISNARGGIVSGDGKLQTIIAGGAGTTGQDAVLRLTNCQHVTCQDFTIVSQGRRDNTARPRVGKATRTRTGPGFAPNGESSASGSVQTRPRSALPLAMRAGSHDVAGKQERRQQ